MAIDTQSMLLKLNPLSPINLGGAMQASMERQRLQLAREQFEEAQRENERQREWQKTEEAGRNARAAMERAESLRKEEAARQATLLAQQQAGLQKFGELAGSGKVQQAEAMSPFLDQLGYDVNTLGNVGGLPVFQMQNRAQEAQRSRSALPPPGMDETAEQSAMRLESGDLGYPTNERGTLDDPGAMRRPSTAAGELALDPGEGSLDEATLDALSPGDADMATAGEFGGDGDATVSVGRGMVPGSLSSGDAYAQALAASQHARDNGNVPLRGPDEEDFQGAVPRNVIDLPAMAAETNARLSPMLKSITGSLPPELQPGAQASAEAAAGLGFEASDALGAYNKAIEPALDVYKSEQNVKAQQAKDERLTPVQQEQLKEIGVKRGNMSFKNAKVGDAVGVIKAADTVEALMKEGGKRNHEKAVNYLMKMTGNVGAQTEADALRVIGRGKLDSIEQLQDWLHERVVGGFSAEEIASINEFVAMQRESATENVYGWLASNDQQMRNPKTHERTRAGYEEFRNGGSIPPELLDQYEARAKKAEAERPGPQSAFDAGDLDPDKLGRVIGHESQGDPTATSVAGASGTMQIMPDNLRAMGIEPEDFKKLSPEEQMPYNIRYLKERGITKDSSAEDYAMAVAAPDPALRSASNDTVVYKKGSKAWEQNKPWRPADGGDITKGSILKFYGLGGEKAESAPASSTKAETKLSMPEPKTPAEKRYLELLKKRDG